MSEENRSTNESAEEKKGGGWGCLKIILLLFALGLIGTVGLTYYISTTPAGKKVINAALDGYAMFNEAKKAPGMDALRAAGCQEALALDVARLRKIVERFDDSAKAELDTNVDVDLLVHCQIPNSDTALTCEGVAEVYIKAAKPQRDFGLVIQDQEPALGGGEKTATRCDGLFSPSGQRKSSLEQLIPEASEMAP